MMEYPDLELALHRRDIESYAVELRYTDPESVEDKRLLRDELAPVQFDLPGLRALSLDSQAYGQTLSASLFADPSVRQAFAVAYSSAQSQDKPLRLRLYIGSSALELHSLRWETLRHPDDDTLLTTGDQVLFSRYLSSRDWRPVRPRSRGDLRALAVVANPSGLAEYRIGETQLAPIDVANELESMQSSLSDFAIDTLPAGSPATLNNLITHLLKGHDILYLVCHGSLVKGETWLWLEDENGAIDRVSGGTLVTRLKEISERPRLIVLVACQSAGSGEQIHSIDEGALAALGPRLAEAGIPAVIAMQGNITMQTVARFMPAFFQELQSDGQIDRAMSRARSTISDRSDAWMPVLFMRMKSGRIWFSPAFADDRRGRGAEKWPAVVNSIRDGECTPILGPDMVQSLLGSRHDIAWRLATEYEYPMDPHDREGLPQVAQYLAINQSPKFLPRRVVQYLCQGIRDRQDQLPAQLETIDLERASRDELIKVLNELITLAWKQRQQRLSVEPHRLLAELPIPVYITTDQSNLLATALRDLGKEPQILLCPWNDQIMRSPRLFKLGEEPDERRPLVYHLFGNLQEPDSLVLTEDDFFDHLIGVTRNNHEIPDIVRERLVDSSLLFLGFRMDDWYFRVFFRTLMNQPGKSRRSGYAHVAVQLAPEEDRILEPERARRFLEQYFEYADISIYWGGAEDFAQELRQKWVRGGA
jgi:hypothetical protein